jgi:ribosome-associated translation inhibitor RaiA
LNNNLKFIIDFKNQGGLNQSQVFSRQESSVSRLFHQEPSEHNRAESEAASLLATQAIDSAQQKLEKQAKKKAAKQEEKRLEKLAKQAKKDAKKDAKKR